MLKHHSLDEFDILRADNPDLLDQVYRLRYQVYCVENKFENSVDHPNEIEFDSFDTYSKHVLLRHRATDKFVGTIRVILPNNVKTLMPTIQMLSMNQIDYNSFLDIEHTAELSRLSISKLMMSSIIDNNQEYKKTTRLVPSISLGLISAALQIGIENNITHVCAMTETSLIKLLSKYSIFLNPIGPMINHHGLRQPCYFVVSDLLKTLQNNRLDIWEIITDKGKFVV